MGAAVQDQAARAARLHALREAAELDTPGQNTEPEVAEDAEPVLKFRNYVVKDDKISHEQTAAANPPKYEAPTAGPDLDAEGEELLLHVAPKKPNWDLRRDVEPKLAKLERRTQRAMIQIMQQQQQQQQQALPEAN